MARKSEKQTSRSGNVHVETVAKPTPQVEFDPYDGSDAIEELVKNARTSMQHAVNYASDFSEEKIADTVLVVLDSTSPIAPPEMKANGQRVFGANLVNRGDLIRIVKARFPGVAEKLTTQTACGHLQYFASTIAGGVIMCTRCDLKLTPNGQTPPLAS